MKVYYFLVLSIISGMSPSFGSSTTGSNSNYADGSAEEISPSGPNAIFGKHNARLNYREAIKHLNQVRS